MSPPVDQTAASFVPPSFLALGDAAPDFELPDVLDKRPVRLSDLTAKKPVVLIFSSFT